MKKKILSAGIIVALAAVAVAGGTLAYFTDEDAKDNTFTTGNVKIELVENFGDNDPSTPEKLLPSTGSAQDGTLKNGVTKEVTVKNIGSEPAYMRVHIAIPQVLDNGDPTFDASQNVLHFNYANGTAAEDKWDWSKTAGAPFEGDWNFYTAEIDGKWYNVYVVTYGSIVPAGEKIAENAMNQVYLDSKVTNEDVEKINNELGKTWEIKVIAEGVQSEGFGDAYEALNAAFGAVGSYNPWA